MSTPITPARFLALLEALEDKPKYLCVLSKQCAPQVWTADEAPTDPEVAYVDYVPGTSIPQLKDTVSVLAALSSKKLRAARNRARRVPGGYAERRAAVEGGAQ